MNTFPIFATELPAVEGAFDASTKHTSAHRQVGTQMGAVCVHDVGLSVLTPEHSHLLTYEILRRCDFRGRHV